MLTVLLSATATGHCLQRCKNPPTPLGLGMLFAKDAVQNRQFLMKLYTDCIPLRCENGFPQTTSFCTAGRPDRSLSSPQTLISVCAVTGTAIAVSAGACSSLPSTDPQKEPLRKAECNDLMTAQAKIKSKGSNITSKAYL
jgi:hypothetical protein